MEESVAILLKATAIGLSKGSCERIDEWVSRQLLERQAEYRGKPHVLQGYLRQIVQRKKFKRPNLSLYLEVIEAYQKEMQEREETQEIVKRALYVIEDNLRAGVEEYEGDRAKLAEIVARD